MAQLTTYHVKPHDEGWAVESLEGQRPSAVEARKADAVKRAREIAQGKEPSKVVVLKQDGTVQDEFTYGDVEEFEEQPGRRTADAGYALAALANDALQLAGEAVKLARTLPSRAQERTQELRDLRSRREELQERLRELREVIEERLDEKATEGRTVADDILSDERIQRVLDQAKTARSQVKAAITSIRKTATEASTSAADAGKEQAEAAKSQTKAAATSVGKTAKTAAAAAKESTDES